MRAFELALPFFFLDSRQSWSVRIEDTERQDEQYFRGDDVSEVKHNIEDFELEYGFSQGLVNSTVKRWGIGYRLSVIGIEMINSGSQMNYHRRCNFLMTKNCPTSISNTK